MRDAVPQTINLKDYAPPAFRISDVALDVGFHSESWRGQQQDEHCLFHSSPQGKRRSVGHSSVNLNRARRVG